MHAKIIVYTDRDDPVTNEELASIGGTAIGDLDFDSWKTEFSPKTYQELVDLLERMLRLLSKCRATCR
jgi:hypothetical protein